MDFSLDDLQRDIAALAARILRAHCTPERLKVLEAEAHRLDTALWAQLADAGLTAVGLPEELGGTGLGFLETCLVLEEAGKAVAPVPLAGHACGLMALAAGGARERAAAIAAGGGWLAASSRRDAGNTLRFRDGRLQGTIGLVEYAEGSAALLLPARVDDGWRLVLVDPDAGGVGFEQQVSTALVPCARVTCNGTPAGVVGDAALPDWLHERLVVAGCALQTGVVDESLAISTRYVAEREQFGQKIGSFQSVNHRMADAFIDLMNLRLITQAAASLLDRQPLATLDVLAAQAWAADAGHRVLASCQHVHGGMGHDRDYVLWRYALAARHHELLHGGASASLAALGEAVAREPAAAVI